MGVFNIQYTAKNMRVLACTLLLFSKPLMAANILEYLTENDRHIKSETYRGPTLEDQVAFMDTDKNGFADVTEVRAFLEKIHGEGYEQALLGKLEASARRQSCSTPFAKALYGQQN